MTGNYRSPAVICSLASFHEISIAIKICIDVINILQKGGLRLTKFIWNNRSILQALPKLTEVNLSVNDIPIEGALGILWNPEIDTFHIKYTLKPILATERGILSLISSIFDPLGLIAPALALRAISTDRIFTDETLRTYLCKVESMLNKSPLTPNSDDIRDFEAFTPNHLLIGYQNDENSFANQTH